MGESFRRRLPESLAPLTVAVEVSFRYEGLSVVGRVRQNNEDSWAAAPELGLFIVADGMGGMPHGDLAARLVTETLPILVKRYAANAAPTTASEALQQLALAVAELSYHLYLSSSQQPEYVGMGSTVAAMQIFGEDALLVHQGDSRIYLWRNAHLYLLTKDHSTVQELIDAGAIKPEEAAFHPAQGEITRYIGMPKIVAPDGKVLPLVKGDRFLLCTDGLSNLVSAANIEKILAAVVLPPAEICQALVKAANLAGGYDNITVVVIDWLKT